jgi:hypothetical protein
VVGGLDEIAGSAVRREGRASEDDQVTGTIHFGGTDRREVFEIGNFFRLY